MAEKGKLIAFSGIDGVGKTSVISYVSKSLKELGVKHHISEEPCKSGNTSVIREIVKYGPDFSEKATLCMVTASRYETIENIIKPLLKEGVNVLTHRWLADSRAYQDWQLASELHKLVCDNLMPDLQIILDAPAKVCIERMKNRKNDERPDKFDNDTEYVMEQRRTMFSRYLFEKDVAFIDANRDIDLVYEEVITEVYRTLGINKEN